MNNAIAVIAFPSDDSVKEAMYYLSLCSIKDYAERHGLALEVITERKYSLPYWERVPHLEKLQAIDLTEKYDRVLFLDLDILIHPEAPNIFKQFPDTNYVYGYDEGRLPWVADDILVFEKWYKVDMQSTMLNGGVMIWNQKAQVISKSFNPENFYPSFDGTAGEQSYVNAMIHHNQIPYALMGQKWNWCPYSDPLLFDDRLKAHFIHYASDGEWINKPSKYVQIQEDAKALGLL